MYFRTRLFCSGILSFLAECIYAGYIRSLSHDWVWAAILTSFLLPFIGFLGTCWVVDDKSYWRRFWLILAASIGYAIGTMVVMSVTK